MQHKFDSDMTPIRSLFNKKSAATAFVVQQCAVNVQINLDVEAGI